MIASRFRDEQDNLKRTGVPAGADPAVAEGFHVRGPAFKSTYQTDMGSSDRDAPIHRPVNDPVGGGLYFTTRDLAAGTTRQSKHAPGYMGHIPSFATGVAAQQGLGQTVHDTFHTKTNLADTYTRRVPGYTGHVPRFSTSTATDIHIPAGLGAPTETGRAAHVVLGHWASIGKAGV